MIRRVRELGEAYDWKYQDEYQTSKVPKDVLDAYGLVVSNIYDYASEKNIGPLYVMYSDMFKMNPRAAGSTYNHQWWAGGYWDHVNGVIKIAVMLYEILSREDKNLPFTLQDAVDVLLVHDIEKPFKHRLQEMKTKEDKSLVRNSLINSYGVELSHAQEFALKTVEGEMEYSNMRGFMRPLGAFCHMCDVWSARGWYDVISDEDLMDRG